MKDVRIHRPTAIRRPTRRLRTNTERRPAMIDLFLHCNKGRMRMHRFLHGNALHRPGALLDCLRDGLHPVDVHALVRRIIHPPFHREQPHRVRPQHDVVDAAQPGRMRRDRQRRRRVVLLTRASECVPRQRAHAMQRLHVEPVLRMRCLGQQRCMPGALECGKRVLADDAIGVELVGLLEGKDGVVGLMASRPVDNEMMAIRTAIAELPQRPLH